MIRFLRHACFLTTNCMNDKRLLEVKYGPRCEADSGLIYRAHMPTYLQAEQVIHYQLKKLCSHLSLRGDIYVNSYKLRELSLVYCKTGFSYTHSKCDRKIIAYFLNIFYCSSSTVFCLSPASQIIADKLIKSPTSRQPSLLPIFSNNQQSMILIGFYSFTSYGFFFCFNGKILTLERVVHLPGIPKD